MTKIINAKDEEKAIKDNKDWLKNKLKKHPVRTTLIISLLVLIGILIILFQVDKHFIKNYKLGFCEIQEEGIKGVYDLSFDIDEESGWKVNHSYKIKVVAKSDFSFHGKAVVYFRPIENNGLFIPTISLEDDSMVFETDKFVEANGYANTSMASEGRYNLCVFIKDHKKESNYEYDFCDSKQISID